VTYLSSAASAASKQIHMARPKKTHSKRHSAVLPPIRCTTEELAAIKSRARVAGLSVSEYVRQSALNGDGIHPPVSNDNAAPGFDPDLVFQLRGIGNNINQQTKVLHATGELPTELKRLWTTLDELLTYIFKRIKIE
jgi:TPP-dependent trihydroxycyclohexane-1,2-dione (THcHDO) dehydratase